MKVTEQELRDKYLKYFEERGHTIVPSSSLVPYNDNTLLFTNAGMVQFKNIFLGIDKKPYKRAVTVQKCVRAGGKHNDLDAVGRTARHHTFFEMLGNFSFGDYFKKEAISFAWGFLTEVLKLDPARLYITVYHSDDEARQIWRNVTGFGDERILGLGKKDNFWAMGDTGPCGPCSEIFYDRGEKYTCDAPKCALGVCDCDRWMEIWNLVFMQYNRDEAGNLTPLPRGCIDTGMGLERTVSVLNEVESNYDIPLFGELMKKIEELIGKKYDRGEGGFPFRVIADHVRSCTFLISDGVLPSNEGRGYVLRRILRRAVRFGKLVGLEDAFLYKLVPHVINLMKDDYPELAEQQSFIERVIRQEEERFQETLNEGLKVVDEVCQKIAQEGRSGFSGTEAFTLYDTYGFPLDLTTDIANERGLTVDQDGFAQAMEEQRKKARLARTEGNAFNAAVALNNLLTGIPATQFCGYDQITAKATIQALIINEKLAEKAQTGDSGYVVLNKTPFYGESGGQVGDTGTISTLGALLEITNTQKLAGGIFLHSFNVKNGEFRKGQEVQASLEKERHLDIKRNHSATHLLQRALRQVLGDHVKQAGSLVMPERLRFDFTHFSALTKVEISCTEELLNQYILANYPITTQEMSMQDATKEGAIALFGEKYGDMVRLVTMGESKELCGGTHCNYTGEIGLAKIISEAGIGAGLRRIEVVTGRASRALWQAQEAQLLAAAELLKTHWPETTKKIEALQTELKIQEKELEKLQAQLTQQSLGNVLAELTEINGVKILVKQVKADDINALRSTLDMIKEKMGTGVIVLAAKESDNSKVNLVAFVSDELLAKGLHAGNIIKAAATACGGGGGGKPNTAQAGIKDPQKIEIALKTASQTIIAQLQ